MPLAACKGLMDREAPNLGGWCRTAGKEAGRVWGRCAACPASGGSARLLPFSRPASVGRGRAHAGQIVCKGWVGRGWPPGVPTPKFSGGLLPCAKVGFPIACLPENLSGEKFSGSPKFSAVCHPCVSAYILCKRVKEKMGVYMAYIYRTSEIEVTRRPKMA